MIVNLKQQVPELLFVYKKQCNLQILFQCVRFEQVQRLDGIIIIVY